MFRKLLRLPSPNWEADLATGIASIDDYLQQIDAGLVGAKSVRRLTLLEARDLLLEASESAQAEEQDQAVREAIHAFGAPENIAQKQRSERYRFFLRFAFSAGLGYAGLMLLFSLISAAEISWTRAAVTFVFHAFFSGSCMGLWAAFGFAQTLPSREEAINDQRSFKVVYPRSSIVAAWICIVLFGLMSLGLILGLFGIGPLGDPGPLWNLVLLVLTASIVVSAAGALFFEIKIEGNSEIIIRLWRKKDRIPLSQIKDFIELSLWRNLLALTFGKAYRLEWIDEHGSTHSLIVGLNGELTNADRFQALIEQAIESRHDAANTEQTRKDQPS